MVQKKSIFFLFVIFLQLLAAADNRVIPVASGEQLGSGISAVVAAGMLWEDVDFCRNMVKKADNLLLYSFRFRRGTIKNRLQICFEPVEDCRDFYISQEGAELVLHCPGSRKMWQEDKEFSRKLLRVMILACLGKEPALESCGWDWLLNGLAGELMLPGKEDEIWRVGYYFGLQNVFLQKRYPEWEKVMLLDGPSASRIEMEICRLLLDISRRLDTGSQRLLQDYVVLLHERKADSVTAFWSTVGYRIASGGRDHMRGLAELDKLAAGRVFSNLSPWPAVKIQEDFEAVGVMTLTAYDLYDAEKYEKITGTWEDWPAWCAEYDMTSAAENVRVLLSDLSKVSGVLVVPRINDLQNLLAGVSPGVALDTVRWNNTLADLRAEIARQKELEAMLFRLEERNPRLNERLKTRIEAVSEHRDFALPSYLENFINENESAISGSRRML